MEKSSQVNAHSYENLNAQVEEDNTNDILMEWEDE